ncbi:indole-3-glycerol phosphate synthase TrpC [Lentisalinibacter orientalis]|uniref:indole-3-glycerol phosphate synthase TrpC n=1 Tax=Lentisalinibacter orientalis TaxID=2992241 RepID=UPI003863B210
MADFLREMAAASRLRCEAARREHPADELRKRIADGEPPPGLVLDRFDIIAEIKHRSPRDGALGVNGGVEVGGAVHDDAARAEIYADGGAAAVSVLTEPSRFGGDLVHLERVAAALAPRGIPAMRKDFLVDPYQLLEARAAGAGGVLLIAALLDDEALADMLDLAEDLQLFVLLECFDAGELERCGRLLDEPRFHERGNDGRLLIGVNSRDLRTLEVDDGRLEALAPLLPHAAPAVAESGLQVPADAVRLATAGYRLALVGTALMQDRRPGQLVRTMRDAGRAALGE